MKGGSAATAVQDLAGNPLATDFTSTFATAANPPTAGGGLDKTANEGSSVSFTGSAGGGTGRSATTGTSGTARPMSREP